MAVQTSHSRRSSSISGVPFIDLRFDGADAETSLKSLVYQIRPKWRAIEQELDIVRFTDGITNTLLKITWKRPGASQTEMDDASVLMRAYGNGTDLIIDRDREATSHNLLSTRKMAPPLLARFQNGLLYGYIPGKVCKAEDLSNRPIWRGVAERLGEWHALVPISAISKHKMTNGVKANLNGAAHCDVQHDSRDPAKRQPVPNVWSVMQTWINALSTNSEKEKARQLMLQQEMERSFGDLDNTNGIGEHGFVFAHCDLLCANVIQIQSPDAPASGDAQPVTFIDYEYATPAPAAFDIANHFAEFAGYNCDYSQVPTKSMRRDFVRVYVASYSKHSGRELGDEDAEALYQEIDRFRGLPGLYWGIWALIQARISQIDFDYAKYAEERLSEYFAWRGEFDGTRLREGKSLPLRERRWAEE